MKQNKIINFLQATIIREKWSCFFIIFLILLYGEFSYSFASKIRILTGSPKTQLENYVISDAISFMSKIFLDTIDTSGANSTYDIIIGTQQNNTEISKQISFGNIILPSGKNSEQGYVLKTINNSIYLAATSEKGIAYGIYDLLEEYGIYFLISGEILPEKSNFKIKTINKTMSPVFKYRGLLPWDNFLSGMSGWNEEDFRLFIDRMVRLKFNIIQFHFYPGLAYYNEVYSDGSRVEPYFIADWANYFVPSQMIGSYAFGNMPYFGNRQWHDNSTDRARGEACQAMLRRVLDYAKQRGITTVVGFAFMQPRGGTFVMTNTRGWDPMPDPLNSHNADLQVERYRRLVQIYPNADYYWMWQVEAGGAFWKNVTNDPAATAMRNQYAYWCPDPNRKGDIDYAYLFLQTVNRLTSAERSRIATGGWDISRLFPGCDRDFPPEIIFNNMNSWNPPEGIRAAQNDYKVSAGRRTWMIDWWEYDGLEWFPQFRIKNKQETMYKACVANNVECVTLDGWKQSGIEHQIKYLSEFSWNPNLTGANFYSDYCGKLYGEAARTILSNMYSVYDSIEGSIPAATTGDYRDMNLAEGWNVLQLSKYAANTTELNSSSWADIVSKCQNLINRQQALINRDQNFINQLKNIRPQLTSSGQYWLDLMINRLEFRTIYVEGLLDINRSYITFNNVGKSSGIASAKTAACADLNNALSHIYDAINKYAQCVRNTSDLGIIGQLNLQVYNIIKKFITDNGGTVEIKKEPFIFVPYCKEIEMIEIVGINGKAITKVNKNAAFPELLPGLYFIKFLNSSGRHVYQKMLLLNKYGVLILKTF
jgi:hypothetical protein